MTMGAAPSSLRQFAEGLREFDGRIQRRELLCAAAGLKPVRVMPHADETDRLLGFVRSHGLGAVEGREPAWIRFDKGKGNWSSGCGLQGDGEEHRLVYVARRQDEALALRDAEESGSAEAFGRALLVPCCCREMFHRHASQAQCVQNDFLCHSFPAPVQSIPWELNLAAQYFDAALVSHYPCSGSCVDSLRIARLAERIVSALLPEDARATRQLLCRIGIYTEYDGICLVDFDQPPTGGFVRRSKWMEVTGSGRLAEFLRDTECFRVVDSEIERAIDGQILRECFDGLRILIPVRDTTTFVTQETKSRE
jgi:hypothetical protein